MACTAMTAVKVRSRTTSTCHRWAWTRSLGMLTILATNLTGTQDQPRSLRNVWPECSRPGRRRGPRRVVRWHVGLIAADLVAVTDPDAELVASAMNAGKQPETPPLRSSGCEPGHSDGHEKRAGRQKK